MAKRREQETMTGVEPMQLSGKLAWSAEEVAAATGLSAQYIRDPANRGELGHVRLGSRYLFLRADLDRATVLLLAEHRILQKEHILQVRPIWSDQDLVFPSLRGTPLDPNNVTKYFNRVVEAAGVERVTLHGLRHMSASYGLAGGVDLVGLSRRLGHSRISTTTDIYGHLTSEADRQVAEGIAARILGRKERPA